MTGVVVAGMLAYIWFNMTFIGNPAFDFDMSNLLAAMGGKFALADIFAGSKGAALLMLFFTGSVGLTFPWPGPNKVKFILAILGTLAAKNKKRLRKASRPQIERSRSSDGVTVEMELGDEYIGYIQLGLVRSRNLFMSRGCGDNVQSLIDSEFRGRSPDIYYVIDVDVEDDFRRKGYGKMLYKEALKMVAPAILITGGCTGMGTTDDAYRVWKSLGRKHKSLGTGPKDTAMAVKRASVNPYLNTPPTKLKRDLKTVKDPAKKKLMQTALNAWRTTVPGPFRKGETIASSKRYFITDMGKVNKLRPQDGGKDIEIPRYGVWDKHSGDVVETSNNLKRLLKKYDVAEDRVHKLARQMTKLAKEVIAAPRLKPIDKKVIEAFVDKKPLENDKAWVSTDGRSLYKLGMGGGKFAVWRGSKISVVSKFAVKSDEVIMRYLRKTAPKRVDMGELTFQSGTDMLYAGQMDGWILAYVPWMDKPVGRLDWSEYQGDYSVKYVEVVPEFRRSGVATALYKKLFRDEGISKRDLSPSMRTDEGAAFRKTLAKDVLALDCKKFEDDNHQQVAMRVHNGA
jgi:GNAT superfamily N-acetyltransferase